MNDERLRRQWLLIAPRNAGKSPFAAAMSPEYLVLDLDDRWREQEKVAGGKSYRITETDPLQIAEEIRPNSRVTTEYPGITKEYFGRLGIPVQLFHSFGASEAKVPDLMDVVVDLTETGTTLRRNGLKIIGQIMESYTVVIANRESFEDAAKRRAIEEIVTLLLGVIDARHQVLLSMNVPAGVMEYVVAALPALKTPTGSRLHGIDYYSIQTVAKKSEVNTLIPNLKAAGAEDSLE